MIAAVVLAAGGASRFGRAKQLVAWEGESLVRRAARSAIDAGCDPVIVVVGAYADAVGAELEGLPVKIAHNRVWQEGMGTSIGVGIEALLGERSPAQGVILLACDQPRIDASLLHRIEEQFDGSSHCMVGCEYGDTIGSPALFGRGLFPDLLCLRGDRGARAMLRRPLAAPRTIAWPDGLLDIDYPEQLSDASARRQPSEH